MKDQIQGLNNYQYGFADEDTSIYKTKKGLNAEIVKEISDIKKEPEWMKEFRLKSYQTFVQMPLPSFGPNLNFIHFMFNFFFLKLFPKFIKNNFNLLKTL